MEPRDESRLSFTSFQWIDAAGRLTDNHPYKAEAIRYSRRVSRMRNSTTGVTAPSRNVMLNISPLATVDFSVEEGILISGESR